MNWRTLAIFILLSAIFTLGEMAQGDSTVDPAYPHSECTANTTTACYCTAGFTTGCTLSDGTVGQLCLGDQEGTSTPCTGAGTCCTEPVMGARFRSQVIAPVRSDIALLQANKYNISFGNPFTLTYIASDLLSLVGTSWLIVPAGQTLTGTMNSSTQGLTLVQQGTGPSFKAQNAAGTNYFTVNNSGQTGMPGISAAANTTSATGFVFTQNNPTQPIAKFVNGVGNTLTIDANGALTTSVTSGESGAGLGVTTAGTGAAISGLAVGSGVLLNLLNGNTVDEFVVGNTGGIISNAHTTTGTPMVAMTQGSTGGVLGLNSSGATDTAFVVTKSGTGGAASITSANASFGVGDSQVTASSYTTGTTASLALTQTNSGEILNATTVAGQITGGPYSNWRIKQGYVTTTNATPTTLLTIPINASRTYFLEARVGARRTSGSSGSAEDGAAYVVQGAYNTISGTVTVIGSVNAEYTAESQGAWNATLVISGSNVLVQVTGAANNNITWNTTTMIQEIGS